MARRRRRASENVRFTPKSGHSQRRFRCPLSAKTGHLISMTAMIGVDLWGSTDDYFLATGS